MKKSSNGFTMRDYKQELKKMAEKYADVNAFFELEPYLKHWGLKK